MLSTKPVVIMGATGTGKTKLSIDVSKRIGGEVVNADKMQLYAGLDSTTNKVRLNDQYGIPRVIQAINHDFSIPFFRSITTTTTESIIRRGNIPMLVGGSTSSIHGYLVEHLDSSLTNPFAIASYQPSLRF
jgi:adenylate isopentenyltransferase (cytokinin synthase)